MGLDSIKPPHDSATVSKRDSSWREELVSSVRVLSRDILTNATGDLAAFLAEVGTTAESIAAKAAAGDPTAKQDLMHLKAQVGLLAAKHQLVAANSATALFGTVVATLTRVAVAALLKV